MIRIVKICTIVALTTSAATGAKAQFGSFDLPRLVFPSDETVNRPDTRGRAQCRNRKCPDDAA